MFFLSKNGGFVTYDLKVIPQISKDSASTQYSGEAQIPRAKPDLKELSVTPAWQLDHQDLGTEDLLIHLSNPSKKAFVSLISAIDSLTTNQFPFNRDQKREETAVLKSSRRGKTGSSAGPADI